MRPPTREEAWAEILAAFPMEEPQHQGGQVIFGIPTDTSRFNGILSDDVYSHVITWRIFEGLTDISPLDGQPVPQLADWWEVAPDGVTYTFHLDPDARWHDGTDVTAAGVVFSLDAALDERTGYIGLPDVAAVLASYLAVDDDTVELTSNGVLAAFLWDVTYYVRIIPKHLWEGIPFEEWVSDPGNTGEDPSRVVGTGPFMLTEWIPGDHATLVRDDAYYGLVPTIDEFVVSIYPEEAASAEALRAGEIDAMDFVPIAQVEALDAAEDIEVATYDSPSFRYYQYNLDPAKTTLFLDPAVREALYIALDRRALVDAVYLGHGEVARGTQPALSPAYAPERVVPTYDHDPERAKQLLA